MKFLVRSDVSLNVPPERLARLLERTREQVGRMDSDVTIDCVYGSLAVEERSRSVKHLIPRACIRC